jgi:Transposase
MPRAANFVVKNGSKIFSLTSSAMPLPVSETIRAHRELILNYFRALKEFSSGVIEGLNNKAKVTMRKSYGFRTFRVTELALYHSLGKLPDPELTHRFLTNRDIRTSLMP